MKILICGSRTITDEKKIFEILNKEIDVCDIVIHGNAKGVDRIADKYCKLNRIGRIILRPIYPDKKEYYLHRNAEMVGMADRVIAFWDEQSRGTWFTMNYAKKRFTPLTVIKMDYEGDKNES